MHAEGASEGASAHRALLEVVVENVDVVEVVAVRASGPVRGRPAVATAATAAMMVAVTAAAVAGLAAVGGVGTREIRLQRGRWWVENVENVDGGATVAVMARWR